MKVVLMRSDGSVEIYGPGVDVPAGVREQMRDIYMRSYRESDPVWFEDRMSQLPIVATVNTGERVVGFAAQSILQLDLGPIGPRRVMDSGFVCIDPQHRVRGVAASVGPAILRWVEQEMPDQVPEMWALKVANPVMVHILITNEMLAWPAGDIAEVVAALRNPSSCMQLVGQRIAEALGADAYDPERWIMHFEGDHVSARASLEGLAPEHASLFDGVDIERGDRLLLLAWPGTSVPPPAWFE